MCFVLSLGGDMLRQEGAPVRAQDTLEAWTACSLGKMMMSQSTVMMTQKNLQKSSCTRTATCKMH